MDPIEETLTNFYLLLDSFFFFNFWSILRYLVRCITGIVLKGILVVFVEGWLFTSP